MDVVSGLDPEQRAAVEAVRGPVCILAGAGTGKTRTVTHRIAHAVHTGAVQPGHVLAVTFTARAAGELRARLRGLGVDRVQARTFHAAALRQLGYFWPRLVGGDMPDLLDQKLPMVARAASRAGLGRLDGASLRDLVTEIEWAKARMLAPESYAAALGARVAPRDPAEVEAAYREYEDFKRRAPALDFDDLLLLTAAGIEEHEDVAAEVRSRYRWFTVDEYQDVNPLQQRLLDAWLGGRDDLCVVGDDDQTIYSFTGASRDYLVGFTRRYPDATVVRLVRDYRSTPQVVGLANAVLRGSEKKLVAQRPDGPAPTFGEHDSEPAEARWVAGRVKELAAAGVPYREMAVLYRINAQSAAYEQALGAAGVPYLVRGGERFFERREVREAVAAVRTAAADPATTVAALPEVLAARVGWRADAPPPSGAARDRWEALAALVGIAEGQDPEAPLAAYLAELDQRIADQHVPSVEGVTLASLHAAKGLEWDAVFLVGLVDGTLPIQHATTDEQVEEERRLLYVGVTRAREHLSLSWALARAEGGRRSRRRSRFLDGVAPGGAEPHRARLAPVCRVCGGSLRTPAAKKLRRCDGCPADVDELVYERLRAWRRERAAELGQPAYCVFTDATLTAIAESRPADVAALSSIPGVGPTKLDKFGQEVLALISDP